MYDFCLKISRSMPSGKQNFTNKHKGQFMEVTGSV